MITAKIIADSANPAGSRLTSFLLKFPRFILAEFNTHRVFSRNAASSRAIPLLKMIKAIQENPAWPERWGSNQSGMQSGEPLSESESEETRRVLDVIRQTSIEGVVYCMTDKVPKQAHKQILNRYLEPWAHITVLATVSGKGLSNFFALRAHADAQPEFQVLAYRMLDAYIKSAPESIEWGAWHIPSFDPKRKILQICNGDLKYVKIATARCARLSYLTFDGDHSPEKDIELHDRLAQSGHWSPFEHCAQAKHDNQISNFDSIAIDDRGGENGLDDVRGRCHWEQYRKQFPQENNSKADLDAILAAKPEWITI